MLSLCSCIIYRNLHFVKRKITKNYKINYKQVTLALFLCFRFFSFPVLQPFRDILENIFSLFCHFGYKVKMGSPKPSPSGKGDRHRRWMRGGTAFRIVGTIGAEVEHIEKATLALPLGELSPQVTERALGRFFK